MEITALNLTHYAFSAGPVGSMSEVVQVGIAAAADVSFGFTGTFVHFFVGLLQSFDFVSPCVFTSWRKHIGL